MWIELEILAAVAGGFGFLAWRSQRRQGRRQRQADQRGLEYRSRGLEPLTPELMRSALFMVADGGHERDVISGDIELGDESVTFTQFDLEFQRDVRGEWAYLDGSPPFRLISPTTVLAYRLPRPLPRLLLKRRGRAEAIRDQDLEVAKSVASFTRDITAIDRAVAVDPPPDLGRTSIEITGLDEYLAFSANPDDARELLESELVTLLQSPSSGGQELVVELVGNLVLIYCASDGELSYEEAVALCRFTDELCRQLLKRTHP
jgi:hypothetical protein